MISESFCVVGRLSPQSRGAFLNGVSEQVQSPGGLRRDTFTSLLLAAFALLVASLFAAAALTGPLAWAVGLIYICYDTWLLSTMVRTSRRAILEQLRAGPDKAGQLPTMAVLITARNEQGALPLALDAVLSQADQPEQLIVIDDGSTHYNTPRNLEGSFFAQGSWQVTGPLVLSAGYEQLHQFGQVDHRLNLAAYFNPVDSLQLGARIAVSPSANTIANWDAALSAEQKIASFVSALVTLRTPAAARHSTSRAARSCHPARPPPRSARRAASSAARSGSSTGHSACASTLPMRTGRLLMPAIAMAAR